MSHAVFLANSFHLSKTKSVDFFIELLQGWYDKVSVIPHKEAWARYPKNPDLLVVFQQLWAPRELEALGARTTVIVPMYDDCPKNKDFWLGYKGFKILCFSSTLGHELTAWGLDCLTVQYYQRVPPVAARGFPRLRGFFWPRTAQLDWSHIRPFVNSVEWESFHLHVTNPEGANHLPLQDEIKRHNLQQTKWFDSPVDYQVALREATVFFAPRRLEGIGQAVLEALSLGLCVVAPNAPTMNEYITSGVDGILYDPDSPGELDLSCAEKLGQAARRRAVAGRQAWEKSLDTVKAFLAGASARGQRRWHPLVRARGRGTALARAIFRLAKRLLKIHHEQF